MCTVTYLPWYLRKCTPFLSAALRTATRCACVLPAHFWTRKLKDSATGTTNICAFVGSRVRYEEEAKRLKTTSSLSSLANLSKHMRQHI